MNAVLDIADVAALVEGGQHDDLPRYRAMAAALARAIASGEVRTGSRLPAERSLAAALSVSRSTVVAAYDCLRADGWAVSRTGSGTYVTAPSRTPPGLALRDMVDGTGTSRRGAAHPIGEMVNLSIARPETFEPELTEAINACASSIGPLTEQLEYATQGLPGLRALVADWLTRRGLPTTEGQVLITTGAQQALGLIAQLYLKPGDSVVLESPTYLGAIDAFRARGAELVAVPASDGAPDPAELERVVRRIDPALVFLMPTCHTITGVVTTDGARRHVAELSCETQVPIIEDDIFAGLTFAEEVPPLAAYAEDAPIFTIGSTSKLLWNGLRVGWLRAPEATVTRLARLKGAVDLGTSMIAQLVAGYLLGRVDDLAQRRVDEMRRSLAEAEDGLRRWLPEWTYQQPAGGRSLWIKLPHGDATEFSQVALRHGVLVVGGPSVSPDGANSQFLRLMHVQRRHALREGLQRLAVAWADYSATTK